MMDILLFDMDGVLLHPRGYHMALKETVRLIGECLGFRRPSIDQETIDEFEAAGVTSEWESSAMCAALMLKVAWELRPDLRLPDNPPLPTVPAHNLPMPDCRAFLDAFQELHPGDSNLGRAAQLIISEPALSSDQREAIEGLLLGAHRIQTSLTHRIFQELVLGSGRFTQTYRIEPHFDCEGTLFAEDRPTLTPNQADQLRRWIRRPDHSAAVFTNRPSQPPAGFFDTPEAEIGLEVIGFEDLPVIGHGGLSWLGERLGLEYGELLKPSPVHILAALYRTLGAQQQPALLAAADLAIEGVQAQEWHTLEGTRISVFEDAAKGVRGACNAKRVLEGAGVHATWHAYGVSTSGSKIRALESAGAQVFPSLQEALVEAGVLNGRAQGG